MVHGLVEYCGLVEPDAWVEAVAGAASGVGGAKSDVVHGENNGEVEAEVDDDEGKLGNHDDEEDDND